MIGIRFSFSGGTLVFLCMNSIMIWEHGEKKKSLGWELICNDLRSLEALYELRYYYLNLMNFSYHTFEGM